MCRYLDRVVRDRLRATLRARQVQRGLPTFRPTPHQYTGCLVIIIPSEPQFVRPAGAFQDGWRHCCRDIVTFLGRCRHLCPIPALGNLTRFKCSPKKVMVWKQQHYNQAPKMLVQWTLLRFYSLEPVFYLPPSRRAECGAR